MITKICGLVNSPFTLNPSAISRSRSSADLPRSVSFPSGGKLTTPFAGTV
jgi:hypothetical protein